MLGGFLMGSVTFTACNNDGGDSKEAAKTDSPKKEEVKAPDSPAIKNAADSPLIKGGDVKPKQTGDAATPPPPGTK